MQKRKAHQSAPASAPFSRVYGADADLPRAGWQHISIPTTMKYINKHKFHLIQFILPTIYINIM